jgi:hypothetical protein
MDIIIQWILELLYGIPSFFTNPFTYLLILVIALQWKRQVDIERKLFSAKLHTIGEGVIQSIFYGVIGGLLASIAFLVLGIVFTIEPFMYLWVIAFFLMLFHIRFLCFAYAGSILGLAAYMVQIGWISLGGQASWLNDLGNILQGIHLPSLFAIVALLHLTEAFLIYLIGGERGTPFFLQSKRGKLVGGFYIQHFWLVPLFVIVGNSPSALPPLFQGWPLFTNLVQGSYGILLLPAVLAFSETAISSTPKQKSRFSAKWLSIYSIILLATATWAIYTPALSIIAILFSALGHECIIFYSRWKEEKNTPIYVHPPNGLKILAVIPHTPAEKMGLQSGEVILKVNGLSVFRRKEMYRALKQNLAFCKLEVINNNGHVKFTKSSLYEKDHHQLGVILAPDEDIPYYIEQNHGNLIQLIRNRLIKKSSKKTIEN